MGCRAGHLLAKGVLESRSGIKASPTEAGFSKTPGFLQASRAVIDKATGFFIEIH